MTFRKSLSKKKGRAYAFFSGLVSSLVPAILLFVLMLLFTAINAFSEFSYLAEDLQEGEKLSDTVKYIIGFSETIAFEPLEITLLAVAVVGILMGILIFRFTADKRTVNVYYSLGIKRSTLFLSKYFAGALSLCVAVAIPIIITYFINLAFVGPSFHLSAALFYYYAGYSLTALLAFSITSAVFSAVGTIFEGCLFSVAVLALPTLIGAFGDLFSSIFLTSSTVGTEVYDLTTEWYYQLGGTITDSITPFNPLGFFSDAVINYAQAGINADGKVFLQTNGGKELWNLPNIFAVMPWFFVVAAVAVVAMLLFKHRKAENCGFLDTNKVLSNAVISIACFGAFFFGFEMYYYYNEGLKKPLIAAFVFAFIAYLVADFLLKRRLRPFFRGMFKLPLHLAAIALIILAFNFSNTFYASYIPEKTEIESVKITSPVDPKYMTGNSTGIGDNIIIDGTMSMSFSWNGILLPEMTSESDINLVYAIHEKLIEGVGSEEKIDNSPVCIEYTLKDGSTKSRQYLVPDYETMDMLLKLFETDAVKAEINNALTEKFESEKDTDENYYKAFSPLNYDYCELTAVSSDLYSANILNLTEEQFNALKEAIAKDFAVMTAKDYFSGELKQYGFLHFEGTSDYYYEDETVTSEGISTDTYPEIETEEDMFFNEEEYEEDSVMTSVNGIYTDLFMSYSDSFDVIVNEKMTNTLAALKSFGCESCFESDIEIKSLSFVKITDESFNLEDWFYSSNGLSCFRDVKAIQPKTDYYGEDIKIERQNLITDKDTINKIISTTRLYGYAYENSYLCIAEYDADGMSFMRSSIIPASLVTEEVTNYSYTQPQSGHDVMWY